MRGRRPGQLVGAVTLGIAALISVPSAAQSPQSASGGGLAPASFDLKASALPFYFEIQAPTALPLIVTGGYGYSSVALNSQPQVIGEAAPIYAPISGSLFLLGGLGGLPQVGVNLLPGLLVGLPATVGLQPLPVDPTLIPAPDLPTFPSPDMPPLGCVSYLPGEPSEASCGGPAQNALGFDIVAATGETHSGGDPADRSTLFSEAAVRTAGIRPTSGNSLTPITVAGIQSAAASRIVEGRVVGGTSTEVSGIDVGGILEIGGVRSSISAATGGKTGTVSLTQDRCAVFDATVAGFPVSIDGGGVHLADSEQAGALADVIGADSPGGAALDDLASEGLGGAEAGETLLNQVLAQAGITARTAGPEGFDPGYAAIDGFFDGVPLIAEDGTSVEVENACLEIVYTIPVSGTTVRMLFGQSTLDMAAFPKLELAAGGGSFGAGGGSVGASLGGGSRPGSISTGSLAAGGPVIPPPRPSDIAAPPAPVPFDLAGAAPTITLMDIYPAFGLLALGLPLLTGASRLTLHRLSQRRIT